MGIDRLDLRYKQAQGTSRDLFATTLRKLP